MIFLVGDYMAVEKVKAEEKIKLTPELANSLFQNEKKRYDAIIKERTKVEHMLIDTERTLSVLKELKDNKNKEIMVNLGSGVYVNAKLENKEKLKFSVGAEVFVEKDLKEITKTIEEKKKNLAKNLKELQNLEIQTQNNLNQLYGFLMKNPPKKS